MAENQWLKGVGCLYRQSEQEEESPDEVRVVLGGRTWVIKPNDDYEIDARRAREDRR
jgi:hypothetical protein